MTNADYKACVDAGRCDLPENTNHYNNPTYENHPVVYVHWNQAKTYCEWRRANLPTEAQWEKAARGSDARTYPWGEDINCDRANYISSCVGDTSEVGSYEGGKSPYGMYDMAGNAWEWVNDWYGERYYLDSPLSNPSGPSSGKYRVFRGGAWVSFDYNVRSAYRNYDLPDRIFSMGLGFRCAKDTTP